MKKIPIFDTHTHLDLDSFDDDRDAVIRRTEIGIFPGGLLPEELDGFEIEMVGVLLPGIDAKSSRRCMELAGKSPIFHAAAALHPNYTGQATDADWQTILELTQRNDIVAIGETGLDRYRDYTPFDVQVEFFHRHIRLAKETDKPILIHNRDAWNDILPILHNEKNLRGVIHAFSGNADQAKECIDLGWHISFAGALTYRNTKFAGLWAAAKTVPIDRLLIETDSPFLTPHPFRGKLPRNEPTMTAMVAHRLAELRQEPLERIAEATTENARKLFGGR